MRTTLIDTTSIERTALGEHGQMAEILNSQLAGAENVVGRLRWLSAGDSLPVESPAGAHQLLYLIEGRGTIMLEGQDYEVSAGAGIYLGPGEFAVIRHDGSEPLELLHLTVPTSTPGESSAE